MHEVLVNRLGGLSLPRKSVVRLTDRPNMTLDVYVKQQCNNNNNNTCLTIGQTRESNAIYLEDFPNHILPMRQSLFYF